MIIKKIEIENFLSYYSQNTMEFTEGPTVIIGQNNTGKSKLFDAFYWVLYDKVFNTREEFWQETRGINIGIANNLAKTECSIDSFVSISVSITFFDEKDNKHLLTREYDIKKIGEDEWSFPKRSSLYYAITDSTTFNTKDSFDREAEDEIKKLFPINLSKYFLFQGENISQIMNLGSRTAFNSALRDLSRIEVFEIAKDYTSKVLKRIRKEFSQQEDKDKQVQQRKITLTKEIDELKENINNIKTEVDNLDAEKRIVNEQIDKKNTELKKYAECAKLIDEISSLEKQINLTNEHKVSLITEQRKSIFDFWMYAGTETILKNFSSFYNRNKVEKKIPEPIRQEFVKEMIENEKCTICGTDAPAGSPQYETIKGYINDKSLDKEIELINQLASVADENLIKVKSVSDEIEEFEKKLDLIESSISNLNTKKKIKVEELRNVKPKDISEDELKQRNFDKIQDDKEKHEAEGDRVRDKLRQLSARLERSETDLKVKNKEYDEVVESSTNKKEKQKVILAGKINDATELFYQHFFDKLIKDIQDKSNEYFLKMTEKNLALSGSVKVDPEVNEVYVTDENGNRQYNINQANKVSLQISFVAAVLAVSNAFWNTYFPFVADAPISALGGNNKVTAVETMLKIFQQSIIILKDDAVTDDPNSIKNDLIRSLILNDDSIKNAYELLMSGESVEEQHTTIKKLK